MRNSIRLLFLVLVLGFVAGVIELFQLRFTAGDVYPSYSTLRADPMGAKIFYESLKKLSGFSVQQNYRPFKNTNADSETAIFFLGADDEYRMSAPVESIVRAGGRLIVTYRDGNWHGSDRRDTKLVDYGDSAIEIPAARFTEKYHGRADSPAFRCNTRMYFVLPKDSTRGCSWTILAERDGLPVMIEGGLGSGTIVLCATTYPFSNEAMQVERQPGLFSWLLADKRRAVIDELHHGISEQAGIVALARRYHLEGIAAALFIVAMLFVWKGAASFVPPPKNIGADDEHPAALGRDSASALVHLLRRNIADSDAARVCLDEWKKSNDKNIARFRETSDLMSEAVLAAGSPIERYNAIKRIWSKRT